MSFDAQQIITDAGALSEDRIDLARTALALASLNHPGISAGRYLSQIDKLAADVAARFKQLCDEGAVDDAGTRLASLQYVLADTEGYEGNKDSYDNLDNADLMMVMDRRKGLPVALSILYIAAARAQGWDVYALNFPGHVICRIDVGPQRLLFDPFDRCRRMEAQDLRALVKMVGGPQAELSASYYDVATNREILIRLQNNIKLRQVEASDYQAALQTVERMRLIDPEEYRLLLDEGVLSFRTGRRRQALEALEAYIGLAPTPRDRQEAAILLQEVRDMPDNYLTE